MYSAFELRSVPSAGPGIIRIRWEGRARLASDAEVSFVVLRQMRDSADNRVLPHLLPIPVREQAHLPQILARRQTVNFHFLQIFSCGGLFSPQTREPDVKRFKSAHELIIAK